MTAIHASSTAKSVLRCAIYTRKSSEEGLEQNFNSLHAQREACEAYVHSQRSEGWRLVPDHYDDGGYSGASLNRPGLQRLLTEVTAGRVDIVVVYKIDRLTRSLADFARIVETLDSRGASFVSITQQFNTTTSMGRLTLNVLLSFAQFEREVTGERIRDKIAASKRKGLWMGGRVPLGYRLVEGKLVVEPREAPLVRHIFDAFLGLGSVARLQQELERQDVRSKQRPNEHGESVGGCVYSRGALYRMLGNPLYVGEIRSGKQQFPGEHEAIVSRMIWAEVQHRLEHKREMRRARPAVCSSATLVGYLEDERGRRLLARQSRKGNRQYTYYVLPACKKKDEHGGKRQRLSLPAYQLDQLVCSTMLDFLRSTADVLERLGTADDPPEVTQALALAIPSLAACWSGDGSTKAGKLLEQCGGRVVVHGTRIHLVFSRTAMRSALLGDTDQASDQLHPAVTSSDDLFRLEVNAKLKKLGAEVRLLIPPKGAVEDDPERLDPLLKAVARGRRFYDALVSGEAWSLISLAAREGVSARYASRMLEAAFLAPEFITALVEGHKVEGLTLDRLRTRLPAHWREQHNELRIVSPPGLHLTANQQPSQLAR